jgi:hypothetical protein
MHVLPLSRVFRRRSLRLPTAAALDEEALKIGAALAWISHHGNLDDFPGSRNERLALMTTAIRRGFAVWERGEDRYKLTKLGKMQAGCYSPNISWAKAPAQDSPVAKGDLKVLLLDRFESRPYTMIATFFALGVAVGTAAAWAPSSGLNDTPSTLSANPQTSSDSSAPVVSNELSAPGSPVTAPQNPPKAAAGPAPPAPTAAPTPHDEAASIGSAPESIAPPRTQAAAPTLPTSMRQEERAPMATLSGSVAGTRPIGHFDGDPSAADLAERPASTTKFVDPQAIPEPKAAPETQLKPASHHRTHDFRSQHAGTVPPGEKTPPGSREVDDGVRPMFAPRARRDPDVAEESIERGPPRYRQHRNLAPNRDPRPAGDDPMGLVGWLFR